MNGGLLEQSEGLEVGRDGRRKIGTFERRYGSCRRGMNVNVRVIAFRLAEGGVRSKGKRALGRAIRFGAATDY